VDGWQRDSKKNGRCRGPSRAAPPPRRPLAALPSSSGELAPTSRAPPTSAEEGGR
jgi:hypothetical protein